MLAAGMTPLLRNIKEGEPISYARGFWDIAEDVINVQFSSQSDRKCDVTVPFGLLFLDLSASGKLLHVEILSSSKIDWIIVPEIPTPSNDETGQVILNTDYDSNLVGKYFLTKRGDRFSVVMSPDTRKWLRIADTVVVGIDRNNEISTIIFEEVVKDLLLIRQIVWSMLKGSNLVNAAINRKRRPSGGALLGNRTIAPP